MSEWRGIVGKGFTAEAFEEYVNGLSPESIAWVKHVVLHNTAEPKFSDWHKVDGLSRMRGLESYYRDAQGWSAGPHLFVADDLIWAFTPLTTPGVHSPSWNAVSWGVETVGDYDSEELSPAVKENLLSALSTLHDATGLDPGTLKMHRDDPLTTHRGCPGAALRAIDWPSLIRSRICTPTLPGGQNA